MEQRATLFAAATPAIYFDISHNSTTSLFTRITIPPTLFSGLDTSPRRLSWTIEVVLDTTMDSFYFSEAKLSPHRAHHQPSQHGPANLYLQVQTASVI
jgi:hypothetical protein